MPVDVYSNETLHAEYSKIPREERLGLVALAEEWQEVTKLLDSKLNAKLTVEQTVQEQKAVSPAPHPLKNKNILLNCHITRSTLIIIDLLLIAGAKVTVTATQDLSVHDDIVNVLKAAGVPFIPGGKIEEKQKDKYFDIIVDCGAGMLQAGVKPKLGAVELTYTDPELYKEQQIDYSIITVDQINTKTVETKYGTGDGLVRALKSHVRTTDDFTTLEIYYNKEIEGLKEKLNVNMSPAKKQVFENNIKDFSKKKFDLENELLFENKKYVVFGYGKVGKGIASNLKKAGVDSKDITIVDINPNACKQAQILDNHDAIQLCEENLPKVKKVLKGAFCAITATGKEGCISKYFDKEDFHEDILKVNMGTPDEWGAKFTEKDVLNRKKAANFALEYPTRMHYLDPIFKSLLLATKEIAVNPALEPGLQPLSLDNDMKIIYEWETNYPHLVDTPMWENIRSQDMDKYTTTLRLPKRANNAPYSQSSDNSSDEDSPKIVCHRRKQKLLTNGKDVYQSSRGGDLFSTSPGAHEPGFWRKPDKLEKLEQKEPPNNPIIPRLRLITTQ